MLTGVNSTMMSRARKKRGRVGEGRKNKLIYKAEDATWVAWGPAASSDAHLDPAAPSRNEHLSADQKQPELWKILLIITVELL